MATWTREQTEQLINLFEQYPNLYNVRDFDYPNRIKRRHNLKEIAEQLKYIRPSTTVKDVVLKLKTLKTQFLKEKNKIRDSKKSGATGEELYVPKLWCYDELRFWDESSNDIYGTSNISVPNVQREDNHSAKTEILYCDYPAETEEMASKNFVESENSSTESNSAVENMLPEKLSPSALELRVEEALKAVNEMANSMSNKPSALRPFLNNLEYEMSMLTDVNLLTETRWKILEVVREAQHQQKTMNDRAICTSTPMRKAPTLKTSNISD